MTLKKEKKIKLRKVKVKVVAYTDITCDSRKKKNEGTRKKKKIFLLFIFTI